MNRRRKGVVAALVATLALASAACGSGDAPGAAATGAPKRGGELTVLVSEGGLARWPTLDPVASGVANHEYRNAIFGQLFTQGPDNKIEPSLATGYTFASDQLSVTITLREGVKFSDGTPFNAAAVKANLDRSLDPKNACRCVPLFKPVTSVETDGDTKVVLTFSRPFPLVIASFVNEAPNWVPSPAALQSMGADAFGQKPVGAGPFAVVSNVANQELVLKRNENYYDTSAPYLDKLTFKTIGSDQTAYAALQSGSADVLEGITTVPLLTQAKQQFTLAPVAAVSVWQLQYNTLKAPLNDQRAREALSYATDADTINKVLFGGLNEKAETPTAPGGLFYQASIDGYRGYDQAKAKELVQQLGGLEVEIMLGGAQEEMQVAEAIKTMWGEAGITVKAINQEPLQTRNDNFASNNWVLDFAFVGNYDPALGLSIDRYFGSDGLNTGVKDPALDAVLERGRQGKDEAARATAYQEAFKIINDKAYNKILFTRQTFNVAAKTVQGLDQGVPWVAWEKVSRSS
ncbi:ABC transporter substrate-binding protein [Plantactinospora mayteni]|uniref:ABC transporter substrate-binding protein n=1 Tax=Plantactinospora mayteni TaxID=566021 RepID=A0ABQ4EZG7_9ACTN|nr:ABC transporter substrate-binding protein [Plantactinospora mayteni]GIH00017.1 ABC transporter substrate-binding protein [Plantactinospora mayteni]